MSDLITVEALRGHLKLMIVAAGSPRAWAQKAGISHSGVYRFIEGGPPTPAVIKAMGFRRVVAYEVLVFNDEVQCQPAARFDKVGL